MPASSSVVIDFYWQNSLEAFAINMTKAITLKAFKKCRANILFIAFNIKDLQQFKSSLSLNKISLSQEIPLRNTSFEILFKMWCQLIPLKTKANEKLYFKKSVLFICLICLYSFKSIHTKVNRYFNYHFIAIRLFLNRPQKKNKDFIF